MPRTPRQLIDDFGLSLNEDGGIGFSDPRARLSPLDAVELHRNRAGIQLLLKSRQAQQRGGSRYGPYGRDLLDRRRPGEPHPFDSFRMPSFNPPRLAPPQMDEGEDEGLEGGDFLDVAPTPPSRPFNRPPSGQPPDFPENPDPGFSRVPGARPMPYFPREPWPTEKSEPMPLPAFLKRPFPGEGPIAKPMPYRPGDHGAPPNDLEEIFGRGRGGESPMQLLKSDASGARPSEEEEAPGQESDPGLQGQIDGVIDRNGLHLNRDGQGFTNEGETWEGSEEGWKFINEHDREIHGRLTELSASTGEAEGAAGETPQAESGPPTEQPAPDSPPEHVPGKNEGLDPKEWELTPEQKQYLQEEQASKAQEPSPSSPGPGLVGPIGGPSGEVSESAAPSGSMSLSPEGTDFIQTHEGRVLGKYKDKADLDTIGYGHKVRPGEDFSKGITKEEAEALYAKDVQEAVDAANKLVKVPLTQNQFDAVVSLIYNIGAGRFAKSRTLTEINAGNTDRAMAEWSEWRRAGGNVIPGLEKRRAREVQLYQKGVYD